MKWKEKWMKSEHFERMQKLNPDSLNNKFMKLTKMLLPWATGNDNSATDGTHPPQ